MPVKLKRASSLGHFNTVELTEVLGDLQNLKFGGTATPSNVSNASNIAYTKQLAININNSTYYLMLDTAAR